MLVIYATRAAREAKREVIEVLYLAGARDSFMSRANSIVIPGGKLDIAMQLILTPMILQLMERSRRASGSRKALQAIQKTA